uniref:hypothetical protein n=1 Tax=Aeromonas caviae TaxID=648 RepID=UPI002B49B566
ARETRAGAKRGCLKQLCATTILKNAEHERGKGVYCAQELYYHIMILEWLVPIFSMANNNFSVLFNGLEHLKIK